MWTREDYTCRLRPEIDCVVNRNEVKHCDCAPFQTRLVSPIRTLAFAKTEKELVGALTVVQHRPTFVSEMCQNFEEASGSPLCQRWSGRFNLAKQAIETLLRHLRYAFSNAFSVYYSLLEARVTHRGKSLQWAG